MATIGSDLHPDLGGRTGADAASGEACAVHPIPGAHRVTTLQLTIRATDHEGTMIGASGFPRHWLFDDTGSLVAEQRRQYKQWMSDSFGRHLWGGDSPALMTHVESALGVAGTTSCAATQADIRRVRQASAGKRARRATRCTSC